MYLAIVALSGFNFFFATARRTVMLPVTRWMLDDVAGGMSSIYLFSSRVEWLNGVECINLRTAFERLIGFSAIERRNGDSGMQIPAL